MKIVIGSAQFGIKYGLLNNKKINLREIKKIEKFSLKENIKFIDTAFAYKNSHEIIKKSKLKNLNIITKIKISNKVKNIESFINKKILEFLKKIKKKTLYGILAHDSKNLKGIRGRIFLSCLKRLKEKKIVKNIGVSIYNPLELPILWKKWIPDIVQAPFNIFDQRLLDSGWMSILHKSKVKIFVRSCLLQGLLVQNNSSSTIKKKYFNYFNEFNTWCKANKISQLEACINFVRQFNQINFLVVGFNSFDQFYKIHDVLRKKKVSITKKFMTNNLNLIDPRKWS